MSERKAFKSPRGVAYYPSLHKSDTFKGKETGKYTLQLILTGDALEQVKAEVEEFLEDTYGPKKAKTAKRPFKTTKPKDGSEPQTFIKFTSNVKDKDGKTKRIPIFDAKGRPVKSKDLNVGSGSVVRVNGTMASFDDEPGVAFYLGAVQIIKLVEYNPGGGFDAVDDEDGFSGDEFDSEETEAEDEDEAEEAVEAPKAPTRTKRDF